MFQFTTTTIINGVNAVDVEGKPLLDSAGAPVARFSGNAKATKHNITIKANNITYILNK